jgi:hypothetical protein
VTWDLDFGSILTSLPEISTQHQLCSSSSSVALAKKKHEEGETSAVIIAYIDRDQR